MAVLDAPMKADPAFIDHRQKEIDRINDLIETLKDELADYAKQEEEATTRLRFALSSRNDALNAAEQYREVLLTRINGPAPTVAVGTRGRG